MRLCTSRLTQQSATLYLSFSLSLFLCRRRKNTWSELIASAWQQRRRESVSGVVIIIIIIIFKDCDWNKRDTPDQILVVGEEFLAVVAPGYNSAILGPRVGGRGRFV